jgi:hypothetical protein
MKRFLLGAVCVVALAAVIAYAADTRAPYMLTPPFTSGHLVTATSDGLGIQDSGSGVSRIFQLTWGPGQNLATNTLPMGQTGAASTAVAAVCIIGNVAAGGTASLDVYYAASGTALGSGTKISTTPCNANGTINTSQSMFSGSVAVPANSFYGVVATGFASGAQLGSGMVQLAVSTP